MLIVTILRLQYLSVWPSVGGKKGLLFEKCQAAVASSLLNTLYLQDSAAF